MEAPGHVRSCDATSKTTKTPVQGAVAWSGRREPSDRHRRSSSRIATTHPANVNDPGQEPGVVHIGADDGIRTRDPHLGKVMLYQLSHVRV